MLVASGKINQYSVAIHCLPKGQRYTDYCKSVGIPTRSPNVFIDSIGGDDMPLSEWRADNPAASALLDKVGADMSNIRTIIMVQSS